MLKTSLALVYLLAIPGASAWAQVARVEIAPELSGALAAPGAFAAPSAVGLGAALPSLAAPALAPAPLAAPALAPALAAAPAAFAAAPAAEPLGAPEASAAAAVPASANDSGFEPANDHEAAAGHDAVSSRALALAKETADALAAGTPDGAAPIPANEDARLAPDSRVAALAPAARPAAAAADKNEHRLTVSDKVALAALGVAVVGGCYVEFRTLMDLFSQWEASLRAGAMDSGLDGGAMVGGILGLRGAAKAAAKAASAPVRRVSKETRDAIVGGVLLLARVAGIVGGATVASNWITDGLIQMEQSLHDSTVPPTDGSPDPNPL
jgi:hypothetical protein